MPSLDTYGDMSFDDKVGLQMFLQAHAARHDIYQQAFSRLGLAFANTNLNSYPDDDWFQRHYSVHAQIGTVVVPNGTTSVTTLVDYDWSDPDSFYTWMQAHTLIHEQIDQTLGINS